MVVSLGLRVVAGSFSIAFLGARARTCTYAHAPTRGRYVGSKTTASTRKLPPKVKLEANVNLTEGANQA
jgi:hypothetical protein